MFGKAMQRWWANLSGQNLDVNVGGQRFQHTSHVNISGDIVGGKIVINGVEQEGMVASPNIKIEILGGVVERVETSQSLTCGDITGGASAGMDLHCGNISGDVDAGMTVKAKDIHGRVDAGMNVEAQTITGNAKAGMSIKATNIGGTTKSGF